MSDIVRLNMLHYPVLNNGFIEVVDSMGTDLTVANAARVSFDVNKEALDLDDEKLILYLAKHNHSSCFRHNVLQFRVQLPEAICRQWYKHVVGISYTQVPINDHGWNEASGRYIDITSMGYHIPSEFRVQSKSNKQGSIVDANGVLDQEALKGRWIAHQKAAEELYHEFVSLGVCKEQARELLTTAFYTKFYWTVSLQALIHFIRLRNHTHAQKEIQDFGKILLEIAMKVWPISTKALIEHSHA